LSAVTFEDLDQTNAPDNTKKPFFMVDTTNEDELLQWLTSTLTQMKTDSWYRLEKIRNNYLRYKGVQYIMQVYQPRDVPETRKRYMPQMVQPMIRDAIDEKVSRLMESKPTIMVIPRDDEERDKVDAKIAKRFLSSVDQLEDLQSLYREWLKNAEIAGESFLWSRWNPDKGDILREYEMLDPQDPKVPMRRALRQGDVECKVISAENCFYEEHPSKDYRDVNFQFIVEYEYTDGLKQDYPHKAGDIHSEPLGTYYFDYSTLEEKPLEGFTRKITFYHKSTKYLPQGFEAVFTTKALLKGTPLPKEYDGKLPARRLIMTKNERELHGESTIEPTRMMASTVNNYENMITKNLMLMSNAKWFVEDGSVDPQQLNNDTGIVKVKPGAGKPVLAQANPVSPQLMEHSKQLTDKFYRFMKSNSVVQGEPPPGVTAFVALQYVSEAESRRLSTEVHHLQTGIVDVNQMILDICAEKYRPGEERTMMVAGKDMRWNMMKYDPATLKKKFSVVMQNTTGLPDSRSGKIQATMETEKTFPGMLPREQVVEMLGFGQSPEKFYDIAGAAAQAAEEENEYLLDGQGGMEPQEYEDHITHWRIHVAGIQNTAFKTKLSPEIQQNMLNHILATEMLMQDMIMKSQTFAQKVAIECPQFPMLMAPLPPPPMIDPATGMPVDPMMGEIPGGPMEAPPMMDETMAGMPSQDQMAPEIPPAPPQPQF